MFSKDEKNSKESNTVIGLSVSVRGDFIGEGNMIVEGQFEGNIKTSGDIYIGDTAKVVAQLEGNEAKIFGEVHGNLRLQGHVEIGPHAIINGDITSSGIIVSKGAIINGTISTGSTKNSN